MKRVKERERHTGAGRAFHPPQAPCWPLQVQAKRKGLCLHICPPRSGCPPWWGSASGSKAANSGQEQFGGVSINHLGWSHYILTPKVTGNILLKQSKMTMNDHPFSQQLSKPRQKGSGMKFPSPSPFGRQAVNTCDGSG